VHIFCDEVLTDCADFEDYNKTDEDESTTTSSTSPDVKVIELNFLQQAEVFEVYPNPNNGRFHVNFSDLQNGTTTFEVVNIFSQIIMSYQTSQSSFDMDLSQLAKGIYFLRANNKTKKVIIN